MYDVDRENNLKRAVAEASEADAIALEEILELASGHGTVRAEALIVVLQDELRHRLEELGERELPEALHYTHAGTIVDGVVTMVELQDA